MNSTFIERLMAFETDLQERMKEFQCSVHLCLGQEEVPVALAESIRAEDWLFSTHRSHGHYLAKGGDPARLIAEIEGSPEGINGGYSGSQSFCDPALNFHSTAIVGGLISAATGVALALRQDNSDAVSVCCIGDAATEQGVFWESLNLASLYRLPILYVCENNGLSVHAPISARQATGLEARVRSFGIDWAKGTNAITKALSTEGRSWMPRFVEVNCERKCVHVSAMEDLRE